MAYKTQYWNWEEAFDKFGFGDGDDEQHNEEVGEFLKEKFGYVPEYISGIHNHYIMSLTKDKKTIEFSGYNEDDVRKILLSEVVAALDKEFSDIPLDNPTNVLLSAFNKKDVPKTVGGVSMLIIRSSHGNLVVDPRSGFVNKTKSQYEDEDLKEINKVDIYEWKKAYPKKTLPPELDILDVGYWLNNGKYETPEYSWREQDLEAGGPGKFLLPLDKRPKDTREYAKRMIKFGEIKAKNQMGGVR